MKLPENTIWEILINVETIVFHVIVLLTQVCIAHVPGSVRRALHTRTQCLQQPCEGRC